jgi:hypothetical protein
MGADVDLDIAMQRPARHRGRGRQVGDHAGIVDQHADGRGLGQQGQPGDLRRRHDLIGDENIGDPRRDERGGLVHFLATDADRATADLGFGDIGTLVRLGMRAQGEARSAHGIRHQVEVVLECVEIDDQCGRLDRGERIADAGRYALHQPIRTTRGCA